MKKRWKGIRTLCLVVCGLMMAGVSAKADNGLGVTKHTKKEIAEYIKETQANIKSDIGYKENKYPNPGKMTMDGAGSLSDIVINSALLKLNQYRYIAGLDAVTANETYSDYAQALAFVKVYGRGLSSDQLGSTLYQNYLEGEKYSNYATGCNGVVPAIDTWMKNSDARQQMMKSSMSETGFGFVYQNTDYYAAMYTGQGDTTVKNVAWPAQITPIAFFDLDDKWTFATGQEESLGNITVTVTRLRDNKKWTFDKSGGLTVSNNTSGLKGYLVFQPKLDSMPSNEQFQVQIAGLVQGNVSYSVEFFNADNYSESTGDAQYDDNGICKYTTLVDGALKHDDTKCPEKNNCNGYMPAACNSEGNYEIGNAGQLYWFAQQVNEEGKSTYNAVLTKDITVNQNVLNADNTLNSGSYMEWTPIGDGVEYAGIFNGQNHTISGLYKKNLSKVTQVVGLFGKIKNPAKVCNIGVIDSYFDVSSGIGTYNGVICGTNNGTIDACYSKGCMNATSQTCGGISGFNKGTISNSYSVSVINGAGTRGGICGLDRGSISNCYFDTDVCSVVDSAHGKTTAAFKSGEVAYLLGTKQSVWGQTIGVDDTPVLNGSKVYKNGDSYSNGQTTTKHHYDANGQCTGCSENIGTIKNNSYKTNYTYGDTIPAPKESNFTIPEGAATPTFTWYDGDQTAISDLNAVASQKRNTIPVDAGTYTLVVETPAQDTETATYDASSIRIKVVMAKATPTDYSRPTGLTAKCGDKLSAVSLKVSNTNEKGSFVWTDSDVELKAGSNEQGQTIQKTAKYIPTDTKNYNEVEGIVLGIQVTHQAVTDSAVTATCEKKGKTEGRHCSACNTVFVKQETIQPLKHHYNADGQCLNCGKSIGTISNNNYKTVYEYCGYAISKPVPANFTFPSGAASPVFTWYNGDQTKIADLNTVLAQKIESEPVNVGIYTLVVETPKQTTDTAEYDASSFRIKIEITKANPTGYIKPTELTAKCGDLLSAVSLKVNDENEKGSFVWTDSNVKLEAGSDVNGQTITKKAKYVPADTNNYNEVDGIELSIKVEHEFKLIGGTSHNAQCTSCKTQSLSTACVGGKATCTSPAICSICGKPYGDVDTTINGHEYEPVYNWSVNGDSCTVDFVCKREGCSGFVQNHELEYRCAVTSKVIKTATCTQEEITTRTATYSFNNIEYTTSKDFVTKSALGHQEVEDPAVEATCVKEGKTAGKHCSVCKTVTLEQKVVPATGQHSWDEGKITKEPTKTEEGIKTYTCTSCQQTKWETIQKLNGDSGNPGGNTGDSGNTDNPGGNTGDSGNTDNPGGNTGDSGNTDNPGGNTGDNGNPNKPGGDTDNGQQPPAPSDTAGGGQQPSTPTDNTETVKVGMVISDDKAAAKYQITNVDKKEVSFVKPVNKKAKKITVPDTVKIDGKTYKVTCVSSKTFSGANKCKTITIGKNVTSIKANAFSGCKNVKTIIFKTTKLTKKTVAKNAFKGITKKTTIKVPKKKVSSYKKIFKSKGLSSKVKVKA